MNYYYLHVWSSGDLDKETIFSDRSVHPPIVKDVGLTIDSWPSDDLFYSFPIFIVAERLKSLLQYEGFEELKFQEIIRINQGLNFSENYPDTVLPRYWHLEINGIAGVDDLGLWERKYLVVSDKALNFLRDNHVSHAEADLLPEDKHEYFNSDKKKFWMYLSQ